MYKALKAIRF